MIKLSDYLNYLNNEVIQARKMADIHAIKVAKEYAENEYLRYFRVPRFSMPVVKLNIPIKINELDSTVSYNFKRDYDSFVSDLNQKIATVNQAKGYSLKHIKKEDLLNNKEIVALFDQFEKIDFSPVKKLEDNLAKVDLDHATNLFFKRIRFSSADNDKAKEADKKEYSRLLKEAFTNRFSPVKADLNNIFIDPDTSKETDKGKILLTLDVELVEEGIRIRRVKDKNGKEVEEIVFE